MLIEFVGLPGSGKTSVSRCTEKLLQDAGHRAADVRALTQDAIPAIVAKTGFLIKHPERISLFGCLEFRKQNPEVFDMLCANQVHLPKLTQWTMDKLSQLFYVKPLIRQGVTALCDEGLTQHGTANFMGRDDQEKFKRYNNALPDDFVLVCVDAPIELALERARRRRRGLTIARYYRDRNETEIMKDLQELIDMACDIRRARGLPVIVLDARTPLEDLGAQLAGQLLDMLGPQDPEVPGLEDCAA